MSFELSGLGLSEADEKFSTVQLRKAVRPARGLNYRSPTRPACFGTCQIAARASWRIRHPCRYQRCKRSSRTWGVRHMHQMRRATDHRGLEKVHDMLRVLRVGIQLLTSQDSLFRESMITAQQ